jgi:hypothetical protein
MKNACIDPSIHMPHCVVAHQQMIFKFQRASTILARQEAVEWYYYTNLGRSGSVLVVRGVRSTPLCSTQLRIMHEAPGQAYYVPKPSTRATYAKSSSCLTYELTYSSTHYSGAFHHLYRVESEQNRCLCTKSPHFLLCQLSRSSNCGQK